VCVWMGALFFSREGVGKCSLGDCGVALFGKLLAFQKYHWMVLEFAVELLFSRSKQNDIRRVI
jgi:hypothetical protein